MGRRGPHSWSKTPLPVGTISVRQHGTNGHHCRMIKVHTGEPRATQWINYARYLWEQAHGPIPKGKSVIHRNGDSLDDRLENLVLGDASDRVFLWHLREPDASKEQHARAREGIRKHNRERARARILLGEILPSKVYLADHAARIVSGPYENARQAMLACGVDRHHSHVRRSWLAVRLGWPTLSPSAALMMSAMAEHPGGLLKPNLHAAMDALAIRMHEPWPTALDWFNQYACALRLKGWLISRREGLYRITQAGLDARSPVCLFLAVRGTEAQRLKDEEWFTVRGPLKETR